MHILMAEDIPSHNKGEAALFYGLKESLKCFEPYDLSVFSINPQIDAENYRDAAHIVDARGVVPPHMLDGQGGGLWKLYNYSIFWVKHLLFCIMFKIFGNAALVLTNSPVWKAYIDADIVLIAHDSFFAPLYNGPQALFCYMLKKPAFVYAGTIKPITKNVNSKKRKLIDSFLCFALNKLAGITVRESLSADYLRSIGVTTDKIPMEILPDLAFILPPASAVEAEEILRNEGISISGNLVGMAVSQRKLQFAFPGQPNMVDRQAKALAPIVEAVNYVTNELDADVVFVPHSIGPTPILDDRVTADMIRAKVDSPERLFIMRGEYTPMEVKAVAAKLDMTISTRLHFTIDSVCMGVPSLLITQDGDLRCHGIVGDMLEQKEYLYNIDEIDADSLISMVSRLWINREKVHAFLEDKVKVVKENTFKNGEFIKHVFSGK